MRADANLSGIWTVCHIVKNLLQESLEETIVILFANVLSYSFAISNFTLYS